MLSFLILAGVFSNVFRNKFLGSMINLQLKTKRTMMMRMMKMMRRTKMKLRVSSSLLFCFKLSISLTIYLFLFFFIKSQLTWIFTTAMVRQLYFGHDWYGTMNLLAFELYVILASMLYCIKLRCLTSVLGWYVSALSLQEWYRTFKEITELP